MGLLPRMDEWSRYFLVVMAYFTKWPEVYLMENPGAAIIPDVLVDSIIAPRGGPQYLH